jgi:hypothetical protein
MVPINAAAIKIFFIQGEFLVFTQYMCHKSVRITMFAYFYNMSVIKSVIILCFGLLPFSAGAWGVLGHRIIGEIASHYLTPKAKKEVKKILGDETMAMASNWGDFIKSDSTYNYLNSWHYFNLPPNLTRAQFNEQLQDVSAANLYSKTRTMIAELQAPGTPPARKVFCLKLLIHFMGDLHQPMHAAHSKDLGGNRLNVYWFRESTNLHRVWDEQLVEFQQLSYTEHVTAIDHMTKDEKIRWQSGTLADWLFESYILAESLYAEVHTGDKLGYDYNYHHVAEMNKRLLLGGLRLASTLNQIFG